MYELTYKQFEMNYKTRTGQGSFTTTDIDFVNLVETAGIRFMQKLYNHVVKHCDDCRDIMDRMTDILSEALAQEKAHFWQATEAQHKLVIKRLNNAIEYLKSK